MSVNLRVTSAIVLDRSYLIVQNLFAYTSEYDDLKMTNALVTVWKVQYSNFDRETR
jgi:hypothetical protein